MYIKKTIAQMEIDSVERALSENLSCEYVEENHYIVYNLDKNTQYDVFIEDGIYRCTCPHHVYRNVQCKHIMKVQQTIQ